MSASKIIPFAIAIEKKRLAHPDRIASRVCVGANLVFALPAMSMFHAASGFVRQAINNGIGGRRDDFRANTRFALTMGYVPITNVAYHTRAVSGGLMSPIPATDLTVIYRVFSGRSVPATQSRLTRATR